MTAVNETAYDELKRLYHSDRKGEITEGLINLALFEYMNDKGDPARSDKLLLRKIVGEWFLIPFEGRIQCAYGQYEDDYCEDPCEGWDCFDDRCECERSRVKWDESGHAVRVDSESESNSDSDEERDYCSNCCDCETCVMWGSGEGGY